MLPDCSTGQVGNHVIVYFQERIKRMREDRKIFLGDLVFIDKLTTWVKMGGVVARPGIGKTALIVQIALNFMFKNEKVLHVSLHEPVSKVSVWYDEIFSRLASDLESPERQILWERMLPFRLIMSFRVEGFRIPVFQERLEELILQNVFKPRAILIDGMSPDQIKRETLASIKSIAERYDFHVWLSLPVLEDGSVTTYFPATLEGTEDLFEAFLFLSPDDETVKITLFRSKEREWETLPVILNPSTFLIVERK